MLSNYLKIALRSLRKQRLLSLINVFGLSVGLACFSLFLLYSVNEFSFDRFHEKGDRIYRVYRWSEAMFGRDASGDASLPMPLGPAMQADLSDVETFVRMRVEWGDELIRVNGEVLRRGLSYADPNFFDVLSFPLLHGDPATALANPTNLVLSREAAIALFGRENPIGETVEIQIDEEFQPFTVSAVAENAPANSTYDFGLLASFERYAQTNHGRRSDGNWRRSAFTTFVLLRPGSDLPADTGQLQAFRDRYYPDTEANLREAGHWEGEGPPVSYRLQPLERVHTNTQVFGGGADPVQPTNVWMLLAIAAGVLLIACINFTTLAIGRSAGRAREVGVRKVVGSNRGQLAAQFLSESLLLAVISSVLGMGIAVALLPAFNALAGRNLAFSLSIYPELGWLLLGLTLLAGLLAGIYPALVLSRFKPIEVLKSKVRLGGSNVLTKSLVTLQFVVSIGLIMATLVALQQVRFLREKNPGFEKQNVAMIDASGGDTERILPLLREELASRPEVIGVAGAELGLGADSGYGRAGWDYNGDFKETYEYFVDHEYLDVLGLELIAGRNFELGIAADSSTSVIVNEAFVNDMGWAVDEAIGQVLTGYDQLRIPIVIGVVKNFHYRSFHDTVEPQLFHQFSDYRPFQFLVRLQPGYPAETLAFLQSVWMRIAPGLPFEYSFLDDSFDRFYRAESRLGNIIGWAGSISIFLACLGLFGLATLSAANRTKEIGIRKVLGASYGSLIRLMSGDFVRLVGIAIVVAAPISWYLMQDWLEGFAYRIDLTLWYVVLAGGAALFITLATVSIQSLRAALADPVEALRYE